MDAAPRDLRPASERAGGYAGMSYANGFVEVAEAAPAAKPAARARKPQRTRH
jgi:hypothetical protein